MQTPTWIRRLPYSFDPLVIVIPGAFLLLIGAIFAQAYYAPPCIRYETQEKCSVMYVKAGSVMIPIENCGPQQVCVAWGAK